MKNAQQKKQDLAAGLAAVHKKLATLEKGVTAIRKDTRFLVNTVPTKTREEVARITIEGMRLVQFERVRAYMRNHPTHTLYSACQAVWRKSDGGYPSLKSLHRFCLDHYAMLA